MLSVPLIAVHRLNCNGIQFLLRIRKLLLPYPVLLKCIYGACSDYISFALKGRISAS
jgi:hypothetical protein